MHAIPMITKQGALMGVWFHSGQMAQVNEFTAKGRDDNLRHLDFQALLQAPTPEGK